VLRAPPVASQKRKAENSDSESGAHCVLRSTDRLEDSEKEARRKRKQAKREKKLAKQIKKVFLMRVVLMLLRNKRNWRRCKREKKKFPK